MPRPLRFYGKKRGHRHTGSERFGVLGEALFFAALLVIGIAGLVVMILNFIVPEWRANRHFVETQCTVLDTEVRTIVEEADNGALAPADRGVRYQPLVEIEYAVDGRRYRTKTYDVVGRTYSTRPEAQNILKNIEPGDSYLCWYDPLDHSRAVLVRGYSWWVYLFLTLPAAFILIGTGGLIYTALRSGTSAERRASIVQRATDLEWLESDQPLTGGALPTVPKHDDVTNSPGTSLAFRLPIATQSGWRLFSLGIVTLCWNVLVIAGLAAAIGGRMTGQGGWLYIALMVPFVLFGLVLIYLFFRHLLVTGGIGMTRIEISGHPLLPGETYELLITQEGKLSVKSLAVHLVCEEAATFRQGTDTRQESLRVWQEEIYRGENFEILQDRAFQGQAEFAMPKGAMHSFATEHNGVRWMLVVEGELAHWPRIERRFPLIVHPAAEEAAL